MSGTNETDGPLVSNVMSSPVITVDPEASLADVARLLVENKVSALPVVDLLGHVLGVISEADILPKEEGAIVRPLGLLHGPGEARRRTKREAVTARQAMTAGAISVEPTCSLRTAARLMESRNLRRLLVISDDDGLVGIVARRDVVAEFTRGDTEIRRDIGDRLRAQVGMAATRVRVSVHDGTLSLVGAVSNKEDLERVRRVAATTRGVLAVRDTVELDIIPHRLELLD